MIPRWFSFFTVQILARSLLVVMLLWLTACSRVAVNLPAVGEASGVHYTGRVIWHDLLTPDAAAAREFYSGLFGWQFESVSLWGEDSQYYLIRNGDAIIGGMLDTRHLRKDVRLVQWVSVFSSADVDAAVAQVRNTGGRVFNGATDVGNRGRLAVVADPQGGLFALLQTAAGDPPDGRAATNGFLWDELWTNDSASARRFYRQLFGYELASKALAGGEDYLYFTAGGQPRAAVIDNPLPGLEPTWVTYVRVADPAATAAKAQALGGEVLLAPQDNPAGGQLAILRDPTGAGFIVQSWEEKR